MSIKDRVDFIMGGMTEHEAEIFLLSLSDAKHARISRNAATILAGWMGGSHTQGNMIFLSVQDAIALEAEVSKRLADREESA